MVVQIRPYNDEKTLVLGCGNRDHPYHDHTGCYTIDSNPKMNPSVVARFGIDDLIPVGFAVFANAKIDFTPECFDEILFEGFILEPYEWCRGFGVNKNTIATLHHLLKDGGHISRAWQGRQPVRVFTRVGTTLTNGMTTINNDEDYVSFYKIMCPRHGHLNYRVNKT